MGDQHSLCSAPATKLDLPQCRAQRQWENAVAWLLRISQLKLLAAAPLENETLSGEQIEQLLSRKAALVRQRSLRFQKAYS